MVLGETMFLTHDNHEHLAMMTYILGRLPSGMIKKSKKSKYFYHGRLNWDFDERNSSNKYIKQHCKPLSRFVATLNFHIQFTKFARILGRPIGGKINRIHFGNFGILINNTTDIRYCRF